MSTPYAGTSEDWHAERGVLLTGHNLASAMHSNLEPSYCNCRFEVQVQAQPNANGEGRICAGCGGSNFRRTGACMTCTDCGSSDGCG